MSSTPLERPLVPDPDAPGMRVAAAVAVLFSGFAVALGTVIVVVTRVGP